MAKKTTKSTTLSVKSTLGKKKATTSPKSSKVKVTPTKVAVSSPKTNVKSVTPQPMAVKHELLSKGQRLHKCTPPPDPSKDAKKNSTQPVISRAELQKALSKLPPLQQSTFNKSGTQLKDSVSRTPQWNAVALFYDLHEGMTHPSDYSGTTTQDVLEWIDEGPNPSNPTIKEFTYDYWNALSYGNLKFSIDVVRDGNGVPKIPKILTNTEDHSPYDYYEIAKTILHADPQRIWATSGFIKVGHIRVIPCVFLVHKYESGAWAKHGWNYHFEKDGDTYLVMDFTQIPLDLTQMSLPNGLNPRNWGHPLMHEFAHTILDGRDLYGPGGCTGYWDILGDFSVPGLMSECSSFFKEKIGWIRFKEVINGPTISNRRLSLRRYTTTGDAIKVVPDPVNNPYEYFLLEYRKSTGTLPHIPDGGLVGGGLLIIHINERLGQGKPWILREAPFFDPEYADYSDFGEALWWGAAQTDQFRVLYPTPTNNSFTPTSQPNSNFYGDRPSGLSITNIRIESNGTVAFDLSINCLSFVGWNVDDKDRGVIGRFSDTSSAVGQEIFMRNTNMAALVFHQGGQVFVKSKQHRQIDGWNLGVDNREIVGDFDGDGFDEVFARSPEWAGIFKFRGSRFRAEMVQNEKIDGWRLGPNDWELAADLDGDGKDEIYIRSPHWAGVMSFSRGRLRLKYIVENSIDGWGLSDNNTEFVGRFSQNGRDEILVKSPNWLGLIVWDSTRNRLTLKKIHEDRVGEWNLGPNDQIHIADLDGDGLDEIYIRSAKWAGVLKWRTNKFVTLWLSENTIPHINNQENLKLTLTPNDKSYAGKFFETKGGIVHRINNKLALLIWENNRMNVRFELSNVYLGDWKLNPNDTFILGDFHKIGTEGYDFDGSQVLPTDFVTNNITDIFIHNAWGTGLLCLNYARTDYNDPNWKDTEWVLSWIQEDTIIRNS